jgi:phosphatidylglycerophosphate synthase
MKPMADDSKLTADCYSSGERAGMVRFQHLRARLLDPLLQLLSRMKITANHVTLFSLVVGLGFCAVWWQSPQWALLCLLLHVLLDGLDGPVARHQGKASAKGSFTDSMADQLVVTASMIVLMVDQYVSILAAAIYIFTYSMVVAFAMVRNALEKPYSWVARPRFVIYIWLALDLLILTPEGWTDTFTYVVWICNAVLAFKMATGFFAIRASLD